MSCHGQLNRGFPCVGVGGHGGRGRKMLCMIVKKGGYDYKRPRMYVGLPSPT